MAETLGHGGGWPSVSPPTGLWARVRSTLDLTVWLWKGSFPLWVSVSLYTVRAGRDHVQILKAKTLTESTQPPPHPENG